MSAPQLVDSACGLWCVLYSRTVSSMTHHHYPRASYIFFSLGFTFGRTQPQFWLVLLIFCLYLHLLVLRGSYKQLHPWEYVQRNKFVVLLA